VVVQKINMVPNFLKGSSLKHWYDMSGIFPSYVENDEQSMLFD
jgi:hypothetical protein